MNENKGIVLSEMQRGFDKLWSVSDALDSKLQNMLNFLSVIVSIAASIEIASFKDGGVFFWLSMISALILYLIAFGIILSGLAPYKSKLPITKSWEVAFERYLRPSEPEVLDLLIVENMRAMDEAETSNVRRANAVDKSSNLTKFIVLLIIIAAPLDLVVRWAWWTYVK
jgi:hypothetical protein